jgi:hypothetical protein
MNKSLRKQLAIAASVAARKRRGKKHQDQLDPPADSNEASSLQSQPGGHKASRRPPIRHAGINE